MADKYKKEILKHSCVDQNGLPKNKAENFCFLPCDPYFEIDNSKFYR